MWWQGEENMPDIIRINYINLKKQLNGNHLILITSENYNDFIQLPDYVLEKLKNGIISLTHLSDLIRVMLLSKFGGLWLDATIYVTRKLPNHINLEYWTPKWKLSIFEYFKYPLWVGLWSLSTINKRTIAQCMGIWYSIPENIIFQCLEDFWLAYWKKESKEPYYWTTEIFLICCMYDNLQEVKKIIDRVPFNNEDCFKLMNIVNEPINEHALNKLFHCTDFFYLSWKANYYKKNSENQESTIFNHLYDNPYYLSELIKKFERSTIN